MGGNPLIHIAELSVAEAAVAWNLVPLALLSSAGILEVDSLQVVFVGVTSRKDSQGVAAMIAVGPVLERTPVLAVVGANLFPVALEVAEQVVWSCKPTVAQLAHMWA